MYRHTRYQGAIVRDHHLLLIRHRHNADGRAYWLAPGGGQEPGESEEECVRREMFEETNLDVQVVRLLIDEPSPAESVYRQFKTYLCSVLSGDAAPGYEPEPDAAAAYTIIDARWFDMRAPAEWYGLVSDDPFTGPLVRRILVELGYPAPDAPFPP